MHKLKKVSLVFIYRDNSHCVYAPSISTHSRVPRNNDYWTGHVKHFYATAADNDDDDENNNDDDTDDELLVTYCRCCFSMRVVQFRPISKPKFSAYI